MANPIKKLLGQTAIYGLTVIVGRALNFLLVPLYVTVFKDPKDYGLISILYSWVAFLIVLLPIGMETAFFKFFSDKKEDEKKVFNTAFTTVIVFNLFFFVLLNLFAQPIADWMLIPEYPLFVRLLGAIVCIDAICSIPLAKLRANNKAAKFAAAQITNIFVNIAFNLILLLFFFDNSKPEEGVAYILIANLIASATKFLFVYKDVISWRFNFNKELTKQMLVYAIPLVIAGFAGIINETIDRILLQRLTYDSLIALPDMTIELAQDEAARKVGIYSACYKLAVLVTLFLQAYRYAAEPFFFGNSQNQDRNKLYAKVMNYLIAAVCTVFLLVTLNIQIFKYFIPNEAYWVGLTVVPILLMANIFLAVYYNQSIWYKLSGQTKYGAYIAISGALLTIILNYLFIPKYGYIACAWATMLVYGFQMVLSYIWGQKHYPIKYNIRKFVLYVGLALLLYKIMEWIAISDGMTQFFTHNAIILIYLGLIVFIEKPSPSKELPLTRKF